MNYGKEGNLTFLTFIFLDLNAILNTKNKLPKFGPKSDPSMFLGYSSMSKAYKVYNRKNQVVKKTIHISFKQKKKDIGQNVRNLEEDLENLSLNNDAQNQHSVQIATRQDNDNSEPPYPQHASDDITEDLEESPIKRRYTGAKDLRVISQNQIIGEPTQGVRTRSSLRIESNMALILEIKPESVDEALQDQSWIDAMEEELNQFEKSKV